MKKSALLIVLSFLFVIFILSSANSQEDMEEIDNSVFDNPTRPAAIFRHDIHNEAADIDDCVVCHHLYEDGQLVEDESSEDQTCNDCHEVDSDNDTLPLMKALHQRCKGCHEERNAGPLMCGKCHIK
jgi:hypothetical protein